MTSKNILKETEIIAKIAQKYGVKCLSVTYNIKGTIDIELDENIYYREQEKLEKEIRNAIPNVKDIYCQIVNCFLGIRKTPRILTQKEVRAKLLRHKSFSVSSKDLFDKKKNPHFSLSPREILKNKKIRKREI